MHPVGDLLPELANNGLPLVAIHIPNTGAPSRKERDELKAFGQERGLRVFDDAKRMERDYPEQMTKVRERVGEFHPDLVLMNFGGNDAQGMVLAGGDVAKYGTSRWEASYRERVRDVVSIGREGWARVPECTGLWHRTR